MHYKIETARARMREIYRNECSRTESHGYTGDTSCVSTLTQGSTMGQTRESVAVRLGPIRELVYGKNVMENIWETP